MKLKFHDYIENLYSTVELLLSTCIILDFFIHMSKIKEKLKKRDKNNNNNKKLKRKTVAH